MKKKKSRRMSLVYHLGIELNYKNSNFNVNWYDEKYDKCVVFLNLKGHVFLTFSLKDFKIKSIQKEFDRYKNLKNISDTILYNEYNELINDVEPLLIKFKEIKKRLKSVNAY